MKTTLLIPLAAPAVSSFAWATPPDACTILTADELNTLAAGTVADVQQRKSGNPSECAYIDKRKGAVPVVSIREVQYAAENESDSSQVARMIESRLH